MLDAVLFFGALCVVEAVEGTDKVAGDAADALKAELAVMLFAAALGASLADDAAVSADGVAVDRVVDGAVADARL